MTAVLPSRDLSPASSMAPDDVREVLSDTPECTSEDDVDGDGLDVADCVELGSDNLMFFAKTTGTVLTPQQIAVLRSAPILQ